MKKTLVINGPAARQAAHGYIDNPMFEGWRFTITENDRSLDQNAKFHAQCSDVARQCKWMSKSLKAWQWKTLFISGHSVATREGAELVPGLEGEFCNIRESSAQMGVRRMASLITYVQAWGDNQGVKWTESRQE